MRIPRSWKVRSCTRGGHTCQDHQGEGHLFFKGQTFTSQGEEGLGGAACPRDAWPGSSTLQVTGRTRPRQRRCHCVLPPDTLSAGLPATGLGSVHHSCHVCDTWLLLPQGPRGPGCASLSQMSGGRESFCLPVNVSSVGGSSWQVQMATAQIFKSLQNGRVVWPVKLPTIAPSFLRALVQSQLIHFRSSTLLIHLGKQKMVQVCRLLDL